METSRTEYSTRNTTVAVVSRMTAILMGFVTRVVFTHTLSESYVGVNGLFTDILNVLSLTELGVGTAITYALYSPIAQKDIKKQQQLMLLYRNFYRGTALCVLLVGLTIVPFLDVLMKNRPQVEHLTLIYLLYLANSVLSYLLVYKRTLIEAHQKNYIVLVYQTTFLVLQDVLQMIILVTTHNFLLFLVMYLVCTVLSNFFISQRADQMYPYLKQPCREKIDRKEKQKIFRNIRAMMMHKLGNVVVNNTDNLLISAFVGVISVGIYSNYYLLIGSVRQVLDQMFQGITASVGNLGVTEEKKKIQDIFETAFFIGQWLYGFAAICLYELLNPFVALAFGKKYLFPENIVLILCINFFMTGTRKAALTFRDSMGLFWFDRYKALVEAGLNLVFSILLVRQFGTLGVFIGTFLSGLFTSVWVEPYVLYREKLKAKLSPFFLRYLGYTAIVAVTWVLTDLLCRLYTGPLFLQLVIRLGICIFLINGLWIFYYHKTNAWKKVVVRLHSICEKYKNTGKKK